MFHKMKMTAELLLLPGKKSMPIVMALLIMLTKISDAGKGSVFKGES